MVCFTKEETAVLPQLQLGQHTSLALHGKCTAEGWRKHGASMTEK
jgi:hypothetical protein